MNTLSSLPPPSFGDTALRGAPAAAQAQPSTASLDAAADGSPLHVGPAGQPRSIDEIERDFLSLLCENQRA